MKWLLELITALLKARAPEAAPVVVSVPDDDPPRGPPDNRSAFLDMIAFAEGTYPGHPLSRDRGYDVIVTGSDGHEIFDDYRAHPFADGRKAKHVKGEIWSTASGRYQFMRKDYWHYKALLHLPDFGPASQDAWAMQLIKERRALADIDAGHFQIAVAKVSNLWASLPGANYPGQKMRQMSALEDLYERAGGKFA